MIPEYLKGMTSVEIVDKHKDKFKDNAYDYIYADVYVKSLQGLLILAVGNALTSINDDSSTWYEANEYEVKSRDRAIAFLNMVLSK